MIITEANLASKSKGMTTDSAANVFAGVRELKNNQELSNLIHLRCSDYVIN